MLANSQRKFASLYDLKWSTKYGSDPIYKLLSTTNIAAHQLMHLCTIKKQPGKSIYEII